MEEQNFKLIDLRPTNATAIYVQLLERLVFQAAIHINLPYDELAEKRMAYKLEHTCAVRPQ